MNNRDRKDLNLQQFYYLVQEINIFNPFNPSAKDDILRTLAYGISSNPILENGVLLRKGEVDCDSWSCPSCKHEFDYNELHYNYCPWCGQRLDWDFSEDFKEEENDR